MSSQPINPKGPKPKVIKSENSKTAGDAKAKKQIAAALHRMKKNSVLGQPKDHGPYTIGPNAPRAAETTPIEEERAEVS